jgi:outer membrane protein assembly factor BamB
MNVTGKILSLSAAAVVASGIVHAKDWPQWGGTSSRNMVSDATNLPIEVDPGKRTKGTEDIDMATTKNIKWVAKVGSSTYGTPTIADGKILVGTNNESPRDPKHIGDRGIVMCLDEKTGEFIWQLSVPKLGAGKVSDWEFLGICSSPLIRDGRCYLITNKCEVICLDMEGLKNGNDGPFKDEDKYTGSTTDMKDADIIWVYDMREELGVFPHNIASSSPLYIDGKLFVTTSNGVDWSHTNVPAPQAPSLIALDPSTGELIGEEAEGIGPEIMHCNWASPAEGEIEGKPVVLFGAGNGFVYCFDTEPKKDEDGFGILQKIWSLDCVPPEYRKDAEGNKIKYATFDGPSEIIATPVVFGDKVIVSIGQDPEHGEGVGMTSCIDLKTGKRIWDYKGEINMVDGKDKGIKMERTISTASVADGIVYVADYRGRVHSLDLETGKPYWVYDTKSHIWSSTLIADGKVYIPNEDGEVVILAAGKEMKKLGTIEFPSPIYSSGVIANGVMYMSTMSHLYAIENKEAK